MVKIGIIGTGYWGKNHVRVFKELLADGIIDELVLCDINERQVRELAEGNIPYTTDYNELLKDPSIDAVDIVTPSNTHYPIGKKFLEANKDVFVEKPMTMNSTEAEELIKVAEKNNRILMVGHIFRFHPAVIELKKRMDRGDFGQIYYMFANRVAFAAPRKDMGVLHALGIHEVDLYCYLLNREYPSSILATIGCYLQPNIEEMACITMEFDKGTKCYAFASWLSPIRGKERNLIVIGSKMSAKIDYLKPQELELFDASIVLENKNKDEDYVFKVQNEGSSVVPLPYKEPLKEELLHFIECVKNHSTPLSDMYVGKRAIELIEAALKSAKEGGAISFEKNKIKKI